MDQNLQKQLRQHRKVKREVADLKALRDKVSKLKDPDLKLLASIDAELKNLQQN